MDSSQRTAPLRVLILGGSSEASALARALAGRDGIAAELSLAGRTLDPIGQPLPTRIGGFGGVDGLAAYIAGQGIDIVVDALHPFAARMRLHIKEAALRTGCRRLVLTRLPWTPQHGDRWTQVADMAAAVAALGTEPRRVFLTIGRLQLAAFAAAPQHRYLVRTIDPVPPGHGLAQAAFIAARGPFDLAGETAIMRAHATDILVSKNSGGAAARPKLEAARALGLPVILVRQPAIGGAASSVEAAVAAIEAHARSLRRGV